MSYDIVHDQMTPKERIKAFREGRSYDRIPCSFNVGAHVARVTGITVSEYHLSADKMVEAQLAAYKRYKTESVGAHPNIVEAIGATVVYPEQSTPYVVDHMIKETGDLDKLEVPDPLTAKPLQVFWEVMHRLVDAVGDEVSVSMGVTGPFLAHHKLLQKMLKSVWQKLMIALKVMY